ncbi:hypothetical protein DFP72DRAFT_1062725 [Ephemerocybe angulata]|uniref:Uncharacterized protein n=1 Tax=Ephemerocybe angulata TaxID=980116 RepID=A0A8H6MEH2_9AGAR|nr:hypothetical protein DFP72DRAFT_1062725 [Tulosesus angulatus]
MSLSLEQLASLTKHFSDSIALEYIQLGFITAFVPTIWPQKWRAGKILFVTAQYPLLTIATFGIIGGDRVYLTLTPNVCRHLALSIAAARKISNISSELVLLLCLHALLGAKWRHLVIMVAVYLGLATASSIMSAEYTTYTLRAVPLTQLDHELGYACSWVGSVPAHFMRGYNIAAYISFANSAYLALLTLVILYVRYRGQTGFLIQTIRRDGGLYVFVFIVIRLLSAIAAAFHLNLGYYNYLLNVIGHLQTWGLPILACRLLLNLRRTDDPDMRTRISTIIFDRKSQDDDDEQTVGRQGELELMTPFAGLGRRRV